MRSVISDCVMPAKTLAPSLLAFILLAMLAGCASSGPPSAETPQRSQPDRATELVKIPSTDGTLIAVECAGRGSTLIIVHGGIGDRTRWTPMFPLLSSRFTVCALDRRGHGESGDSPEYSLQKEAEDIAAVVDSRPGPVFLLGHSYGGVAALEATFLTTRISKLMLYEAPVQERIDLGVVARIERLIQDGEPEEAVATFLRDLVMLSPGEVKAMRTRPVWQALVASIDSHPRQMRALAAYEFDEERMSTLEVPTLLIRGSETTSPNLKRSFDTLMATLPNRTEVVLEGQEHNAMDTGRERLAQAITEFLLDNTME